MLKNFEGKSCEMNEYFLFKNIVFKILKVKTLKNLKHFKDRKLTKLTIFN